MITKEDIRRGYYLNNYDMPVQHYRIIAEPFEDGYFCLQWTNISTGSSDFVREDGEVKQFGSKRQAYDYLKNSQCSELVKVHIGYITAM